MGFAPLRISQKYISQADAAVLLGVTSRSVRNMISDGRLRGYRLGRTVRLRIDEVEAALVPFGGDA
ncbi:excisionase family DNA-binding protein [Mycobacteroides abscessus]|uniref:excisionase family DNA-binding protein n=1 Tax=Mycobacteroides abscessus TaxID=36809 RepID=UPI0009A5E45C|nr:excisionase family DNA-binding protein [Mycobacteroides abscessus]SLF31386.1 phiRv2 prophage protein [Mycobacteroides abscessus subsp. abscessus]